MKPMIAAVAVAVAAAVAMACAPAAQAPTPIVGDLEAVPDGDGGTLALVATATKWQRHQNGGGDGRSISSPASRWSAPSSRIPAQSSASNNRR